MSDNPTEQLARPFIWEAQESRSAGWDFVAMPQEPQRRRSCRCRFLQPTRRSNALFWRLSLLHQGGRRRSSSRRWCRRCTSLWLTRFRSETERTAFCQTSSLVKFAVERAEDRRRLPPPSRPGALRVSPRRQADAPRRTGRPGSPTLSASCECTLTYTQTGMTACPKCVRSHLSLLDRQVPCLDQQLPSCFSGVTVKTSGDFNDQTILI